jgi:hypothetical protein
MTTWAEVLENGQKIGYADWGPLVASTDVDEKILELARTWMPTYLRRLKEERDLELQNPREYATMLTDEELLDHPLPAVVSKTAEMASAQGGMEKMYAGEWTTEVSVSVRGRDPRETRRTASVFEAVTRRLLTQHGRGTPLDWIHYTGMRLDQVPGDDRAGRYVLKATSIFQVWTNQIVDPTAGPDIPDADTYGPWPLARTVDVDLQKLPLEEEPDGDE